MIPEQILVEPKRGDRLARQEYQDPNVLRHDGKRPYYYIRYRIRVVAGEGKLGRKEIWHPLGYCDEMTKRAALRERDRIMQQVNHQIYTVRNQISLEDFAQIYEQQHLPTLSLGARRQQESLLRIHVLPALGRYRLCDLEDGLAIQSMLNAKAEAGLAWWTRKGMKAVLSSMFGRATDWNYWDKRNPVLRVRLGRKRAKYEKRILTDVQFCALLEQLPATVRLLVETLVSTGMRICEALGLRWRCVDLERGIVHVEERLYRGELAAPKTERSLRALALGELLGAYRRMQPAGPRPEEFVFHSNGKPLDDRELLRNILRPAADRLGIGFPGFGWHTFRRMHLTLIQEEGATTFEAMAQAGHSRPSMTGEYTIIGMERREAAVRRLQRRLGLRARQLEVA